MTGIELDEVRAAIAALPGKTVQPWKDGDQRCHCSHCALCGDCYPTEVLNEHEQECRAAVLKALRGTPDAGTCHGYCDTCLETCTR